MVSRSGADGNRSVAVERLWATILSEALTTQAGEELRALYARTSGGAQFGDVLAWLLEIHDTFYLRDNIVSAACTGPAVNGDVDAVLINNTILKFEIKAQTKKATFSDITQSDWIRDQTDLLSFLVNTDPSVAAELSQVGSDGLAQVAVTPGWGVVDLHLADLAGVTDARARGSVGVRHPVDLEAFLDRKWFLHVTEEGARLCCIGELVPVRYFLDGGIPDLQIRENRKGMALQSLDPEGKPWFTYHLYPGPKIKGRHKMHGRAFEGVWAG